MMHFLSSRSSLSRLFKDVLPILIAPLLLPILACGPPKLVDSLLELPAPRVEDLEATARQHLDDTLDHWRETLRTSREIGELAHQASQVARVLHAYGALEAADVAYRNAIQLAPDDSRVVYLHGTLLQELGEDQAAIGPLERAVEITPGDVASRLRLAHSLLAVGRAEDAKKWIASVLGDDPKSAAGYALAGRWELEFGDPKAAVLALDRALALQPVADSLHQVMASAFERIGDVGRADAHRRAGGRVPIHFPDPQIDDLGRLLRSSKAHLRRARQARAAGDLQVAIREHRLAVDSDPHNAMTRAALGAMLALAEDLDGAVEELRKATRLGQDPRIFVSLADVLRLRGEPLKAAKVYQRALQLKPADLKAQLGLARALVGAGQASAAAEAYRTLLSRQPGHVQATSELAELLSATT